MAMTLLVQQHVARNAAGYARSPGYIVVTNNVYKVNSSRAGR